MLTKRLLGGNHSSIFGSGSSYGNITGAATYDSGTGTWNVTGAATVDIQSETGTAMLMCRNIIVNAGTLTVTTNCKGLILFASESVQVLNGGTIHINKLGKAGNFGNLTPLDLMPTAWKNSVRQSGLLTYMIQGEGQIGAGSQCAGSWYSPSAGLTPPDAGPMQTGGGMSGGSGGGCSGIGGKGGPCSGGAGSGAVYNGSSADAGNYGGPGSAGSGESDTTPGGGAGDPPGLGGGYGGNRDIRAGKGAGGGLLMLFTPNLLIQAACYVSADGAGGGSGSSSGGSAGGGCVVIVTNPGALSNAGGITANGGLSGDGYRQGLGGGNGSVNIFTSWN